MKSSKTQWYEGRVSYTKQDADGKEVRVTEAYLVEETSYRAVEQFLHLVASEWSSLGVATIEGIKRVRLADVLGDPTLEGCKYYRCKVEYITLDEANGKEKRTGATLVVIAEDYYGAVARLKTYLDAGKADSNVVSVAEYAIVDAVLYSAEEVPTEQTEVTSLTNKSEDEMQEVTITGNIGKDAIEEMRGDGSRYITFSVAVNNGKDMGPSWYGVFVHGDYQKVQPYLVKGARVLVRGRLSAGAYQNRHGETVVSLSISTSTGGVEIQKFADDGNGQAESHGGVAQMNPNVPF